MIFTTTNSYAYDLEIYNITTPKIKDISFIDKNIIEIKTLIEKVEEKINKQKINISKTEYSDLQTKMNFIKSDFKLIEDSFKKNNTDLTKTYIESVLQKIRNIQLNLMPSRVVETRGLYIDTDNIPSNKEDITKLVQEIKYANFNIIYPEVFRRGYSIFNNNVSDTEDRFKKASFDVLDYLIKEAHKNNIDVYPWIWTFRVKSPLYSDYFLKKYPDLIAKREVSRFENREPLFLSPASSKARNLMIKFLRNLTVNYDIDGLLLDYIRYDETMSYDSITEQNFKEYYYQKYNKFPPKDISDNPGVLKELQFWREEQVTSFVKTSNVILKNLKPKLKIGVAIFRTEKEGRLLKMQDWRHWASNNYIDFVCPMLYTDQIKDLNDWLNSETNKGTRFDYLYPSLGAHRFYKADDIYPLAGLIHQRNIPGFNVFSLEHIGRENLPDLRKSIFKNSALIPEKDINKSFNTLLDDVNIKLTRINYKFDNNNLKEMVKKSDFEGLIKNIEKHLKLVNNQNKEIIVDLNYLIYLSKIEKNRDNAKTNYTKPTEPPLPIFPLN